jgi:tRNA (mo5U34)-methyltransferase
VSNFDHVNRSGFADQVNSIPWFHSIDLGHGLVTKGAKSLSTLAREQKEIFDPIRISGATVLDVGAWNGAHSFAAKQRGAARVLATDHYVWRHAGHRGREGFDLANTALGLNIEAADIDVHQISPTSVGRWDVVLFLGVLYHLPSPLEGLETVAEVADDCLVVETQTDLDLVKSRKPLLSYHPGSSLAKDPTNYFTPNAAFVIETLRECGFTFFDTRLYSKRLTVHAWRNMKRRIAGTRAEINIKVSPWRRLMDRIGEASR